jgi:PAS domain S-box-containing protein
LGAKTLTVLFANEDFIRATGLSSGLPLGTVLQAAERHALEQAIDQAPPTGERRLVGEAFRLSREHDALWSVQMARTGEGKEAPDMIFLTATRLAALIQTIDARNDTIDCQDVVIERQDGAMEDQASTIGGQAQLLKLLMTHVPWGVIVADSQFRIEQISDCGGDFLGYAHQGSSGRLLGTKGSSSHIFQKDGKEARFEELPLFRAITDGQCIVGEEWMTLDPSSGKYRTMLCNAAPIHDDDGTITGGITTFGDITPLKDLILRLGAMLNQKDVLLSELHHRVKNNLQTVVSIATTEKLRHPEATEALDSIIGHVSTVGAIHETLGLSPDPSLVPFANYTRKICQELRQLYRGDKINIVVDGVENLPLDIATPLGLIINELVTNSLKHAFVGRAAGVIKVTLEVTDQAYILAISDDGVGLPCKLYRPSLGMRLVDRLSQQLGGVLQSDSSAESGTTWKLRFPFETNVRKAAAV